MPASLTTHIDHSLQESVRTLSNFSNNPDNTSTLGKMSDAIANAFKAGRKLLTCGNGGSACEAAHFAEEFAGRYRKHRRALPALSLTEPAWLTCVGNDYGFDHIFSRGVEAYGQAGDVFLAMSTSGNSQNIINAVKTAREKQMKILLFLGRNGGLLKAAGDLCLIVQADTSDRIQEIHMICMHILIEGVERILFPENYSA